MLRVQSPFWNGYGLRYSGVSFVCTVQFARWKSKLTGPTVTVSSEGIWKPETGA